MQIKVNGINHSFADEKLSITQILEKLNYTFPIIVVKHKEAIIQKAEFDSHIVYDNDEISVLHIFAGG